MRLALFYHSVRSDWNHGNAHFLRGMVRALQARGHEVTVYEPARGWSVAQLIEDQGPAALELFDAHFPDIRWHAYEEDAVDLEAWLGDVDVAIVHEWTAPELVAALSRYRQRRSGLRLLFHDTHHRMVSDPGAMAGLALEGYDGILAFGAVLAEAYRRAGWGNAVFTWHEAADTSTFRPDPAAAPAQDVIWVGNWGDGERARELESYLIEPVAALNAALTVHGVRYPDPALAALRRIGARYRGWIPGPQVADAFAHSRLTIHVPRRWYRERLPGIPTIRMFEALACGVPLISAPWHDSERLFAAGEDYLLARNPAEMQAHMKRLLADPHEGAALAARGLERIRGRHTCDHRAVELESIVEQLGMGARETRARA